MGSGAAPHLAEGPGPNSFPGRGPSVAGTWRASRGGGGGGLGRETTDQSACKEWTGSRVTYDIGHVLGGVCRQCFGRPFGSYWVQLNLRSSKRKQSIIVYSHNLVSYLLDPKVKTIITSLCSYMCVLLCV